MFVIGTAGHVDHGKSTLIRAMSGMDPDRLKEEKARGMTIELGFAWVTLPSGREVSIVDVPGHERFVRNMLMGAGGVDLALLVIAADEGVMPQTREHLAILDLLGIRHGILVITKSDLVDGEWLDMVSAEAEDVLAGTTLAGSPVARVSGETGQGISGLLALIDARLDALPARADLNRPRLPVDRSFTMSGFGAVVTGTLSGGRLRTGMEVELLPSGKRARIRGLQSHRTALDEAAPGSRVAVNLSGIEHSEIARGDLLTTPGWLAPTQAFDISLHVIAGSPRPVRHNHRLRLFTGTREVDATVRLLQGETVAPGGSGWAQVRTGEPVAVVRGDRFVLRDTQDTLGGGAVLDPHAARHRRNDPAVVSRLETLASGSGEDVLLQSLRKSEPSALAELARQCDMAEADAQALVDGLAASGAVIRVGESPQPLLYSLDGWSALRSAVEQALGGYHRQHPLRPGMPREELRSRLKLKAAVFAPVAEALERHGVLSSSGATLKLPSYTPEPTPAEQARAESYLALLASNPYSPPTDSPLDSELLAWLESEGKVVRCGDVVFLSSAFAEMRQRLIAHMTGSPPFTVNQVRDLFGTSRKYVLALLAELDRQGATVRQGDERTLR